MTEELLKHINNAVEDFAKLGCSQKKDTEPIRQALIHAKENPNSFLLKGRTVYNQADFLHINDVLFERLANSYMENIKATLGNYIDYRDIGLGDEEKFSTNYNYKLIYYDLKNEIQVHDIDKYSVAIIPQTIKVFDILEIVNVFMKNGDFSVLRNEFVNKIKLFLEYSISKIVERIPNFKKVLEINPLPIKVTRDGVGGVFGYIKAEEIEMERCQDYMCHNGVYDFDEAKLISQLNYVERIGIGAVYDLINDDVTRGKNSYEFCFRFLTPDCSAFENESEWSTAKVYANTYDDAIKKLQLTIHENCHSLRYDIKEVKNI